MHRGFFRRPSLQNWNKPLSFDIFLAQKLGQECNAATVDGNLVNCDKIVRGEHAANCDFLDDAGFFKRPSASIDVRENQAGMVFEVLWLL